MSRTYTVTPIAPRAAAGGAMYRFDFDSTPPPGNNHVSFDQADAALTTRLLFDNDSVDNVDIHDGLLTLPIGTEIVLQDQGVYTRQVTFLVAAAPIDATSHVEIPVTFVAQAGDAFTNNLGLVVLFYGAPPPPAVPVEPITVEELIGIARIPPGDEEPALMPGYISAARQQVERDTDLTLVAETVLVTYDAGDREMFALPTPSRAVRAVSYRGDDGHLHDIGGDWYHLVMRPRARLVWLATGTSAPPPARANEWAIELEVGYTPETIPPALKFAVGLLAAHYLTTGRDLASVGLMVSDMPMGYDDAINPWRIVTVI